MKNCDLGEVYTYNPFIQGILKCDDYEKNIFKEGRAKQPCLPIFLP